MVSLNTQLLAAKFATAANYYSDAEESDAGTPVSALEPPATTLRKRCM